MQGQKSLRQRQEQGLPHCQWHMLLQGFYSYAVKLESEMDILQILTFRFTDSVIKALNGQEGVVECAYVQSEITEASFFATPILLVNEFIIFFSSFI